uniref:Histone H2A n=1 Tax=Zea mays TaxID=4577 RepID=A0A804UMQ0_MAIZE
MVRGADLRDVSLTPLDLRGRGRPRFVFESTIRWIGRADVHPRLSGDGGRQRGGGEVCVWAEAGRRAKEECGVANCQGRAPVPVGRIRWYLKEGQYGQRVGRGAPVFLASVLEYLAAEVMELAGAAARDSKRGRIVPRYLLLAIRKDEELGNLLVEVTITHDGVLSNINPALLPNKVVAAAGSSKSPTKAAAK